MYKILGVDDSVNECDCCGKKNLKYTFAVDLNGEVLHYGSTCVTYHTKMTEKEIKIEIATEENGRIMTATRLFKSTNEYITKEVKQNEAHKLRLVGKDFRNFCKREQDLASNKAKELAKQFNVSEHKIN